MCAWDALFSTPTVAETVEQLAERIRRPKELAAEQGREIDIYSVGVITCRPTMSEAAEYHHHCIVDDVGWNAVDSILAMKGISPETLGEEEFKRRRRHQTHGMGGIPMVGDPDHVAATIPRMSQAGLRGIGVSFVNLPYFCDEVLARLEKMGVREARR